jgi:ribosomal protein S18 acetylase RimI-like enzyme
MPLTVRHGLDDRDLAAIRALEQEVVAADGGRLKLEWGVLETRTDDDTDLLWWEGDALVGFLGLYAFGPPDAEVTGMVAPSWRRRGIASALLADARPHARAQGYDRLLLVTPSVSAAGAAFARAQGATRGPSEHFLVLGSTPSGPDRDPSVTLRVAAESDRAALLTLLAAAFGQTPSGDFLHRHGDTTYVVEQQGRPVGTVRLSVHPGPDGTTGGVYGFAVDPALQGRGIGRDVLERSCRLLREQGCTRVTLEVATENDAALGLYLSTGFRQEASEDYWALEIAGA